MTTSNNRIISLVPAFVVMLVLVCGMIWFGINTANLLNKQSDQVAYNYVPRLELLSELQQILSRQQIRLYHYALDSSNKDALATQESLRVQIENNIQRMDALVSERSQMDDLRFNIKEHRRIIKTIESLPDDTYLATKLAAAQKQLEQISSILKSLQQKTYDLTERNVDKTIKKVQHLTLILLLFSTSIVVIAGFALTMLYGRQHDRDQLYQIAYTDKITGLPNYRLLQQRLQQAKQGTLVAIKADRLPRITATYGSNFSNKVLITATKWLQARLDESDCDGELFRYHDDGWAILYKTKQTNDSPFLYALTQIDKEPFLIDGRFITLVLKAGTTQFPEDGTEAESLLRNADAAILAITSKRSAYNHYFPALTADAHQWLTIESGLHHALKNNELELFYQAKVDTASGKLVGSEALLRWLHDGEMISPGIFIPVAEQSGLIVPIGTWVIEQACRQLALWRSKGIVLFPVSVNVSAQQFQQDDFFNIVTSTLERYQLDTRLLELEITEEVAAMNPKLVIETMQRLKQAGIRLAIDDFGTGYSSLNYLQRLPVDTIKIDRSFVASIDTNSDNAAIVDMILSLAVQKKLNVVAEGVETKDELRVLRRTSCHQVQGFLFSKPEPQEQFYQRLAQASDLSSPEST